MAKRLLPEDNLQNPVVWLYCIWTAVIILSTQIMAPPLLFGEPAGPTHNQITYRLILLLYSIAFLFALTAFWLVVLVLIGESARVFKCLSVRGWEVIERSRPVLSRSRLWRWASSSLLVDLVLVFLLFAVVMPPLILFQIGTTYARLTMDILMWVLNRYAGIHPLRTDHESSQSH